MEFLAGLAVGAVGTLVGVAGFLAWVNRPRRVLPKQDARALLRGKEFHNYFTERK